MNFLHYAIVMFVVCSATLIVVSLLTKAPERHKVAGLTFAAVDDKLETTAVGGQSFRPSAETVAEHWVNVAFSCLLVAAVVLLWIHFR